MSLEHLSYSTSSFQDGRSFGAAGPYEQLSGTAAFAVNPLLPRNACITELKLVSRDQDGMVRFSAEFLILRPVDPAKRNRRLFLDVPNRGGPRLLRNSNVGLPPPLHSPLDTTGDGWLLQQGYMLASCGWQHDVLDMPGMLKACLPEAMIDGRPVEGTVICQLETFRKTSCLPLSHAGHIPYKVVDPEEAGATLRIRDYANGPSRLIPRDQWLFARSGPEGTQPDREHIYLSDGFEPGKHYEVVYTGCGAVPTALGLVGMMDFTSFLRNAPESSGNPCSGTIDHVYAFGGSQPGGVLRLMRELDLFRDQAGSNVIDGFIAHGAGVFKTEVNWRFGHPSAFNPLSPSFFGRLSDEAIEGNSADQPKMIFTISGPDYWDLFGSLSHVSLDGRDDLSLPDNVRILYMAGCPHVRGAISDFIGSNLATYPISHLDFAPFMRAAITNLDRWVGEGIPFPPSRHPTLAAGTLIDKRIAASKVVAATGTVAPAHPSTLGALDFGPRVEQWIMDKAPTRGAEYAMLVCEVDEDGNDIDGLIHPEVSAPLATYAPWNRRSKEIGAEEEGMTLLGAMLPFSLRDPPSHGDNRRSIAARYSSCEDYLTKVRAAVQALIADRMILPEDEEAVIETARDRYTSLTTGNGSSMAK